MRYMLFGSGKCYYARGGANDFVKASDDVGELVNYAKMRFEENVLEWWHIFDIEAQEIAYGTETQAHGADDLPRGMGCYLRNLIQP